MTVAQAIDTVGPVNKKIAIFGILAMLATGLGACASTTEAAPTPTASESTPSSPPSSSSPSAAPSPTEDAAPTLADLDGTWCQAIDPTNCMTFANGATADGATVTAMDGDEGAPCVTAGISDGGGGFVVFYCRAGMSPATPVVTDATSTLNLDNQSYERLFATQNPPYVDTWYREADIAQAVQTD